MFETRIQPLLDKLRDHPDEFALDSYQLQHVGSGIKIWIANGFWFYGTGDMGEVRFTFADKIRFGVAYRKMKVTQRDKLASLMEQLHDS